ncbi:helix-turn-helix transcriptional regulator [Actinomadura sp. ATCC 31491]|uniref:Helix-turn-helix transcriptional regulator n=1 Tax=Actinomadura luzonensis TaxID=2805427 RepID=A0ABT0G562_9ACTN|nr:helix-turn-helix transcriptional regulator [Actinomadura luzonensis]MCK2219715.1 helix-turn-helix transcriptional regulator [Actinomadura luzonensis]
MVDPSTPPGAQFFQRTELERAQRGWSKIDLCQRAGIGRVTYDRLASQKNPPIVRTVKKLCDTLDIDLAEGLRLAGLDTTGQPQQPDWAAAFQQGIAEIGKGFEQASRVFAAQGAMGWAYRGDLDQTRKALAGMQPEQLQEISAAATLLAALADEELSTR